MVDEDYIPPLSQNPNKLRRIYSERKLGEKWSELSRKYNTNPAWLRVLVKKYIKDNKL